MKKYHPRDVYFLTNILLFRTHHQRNSTTELTTEDWRRRDPRTTLTRLIWSRLNSYLATPPIAKMICVKNGRATPKQLPKCFFHVFSIFVFILFRYETPYSMTRVNLNKSNKVLTFITTRSKDIPTRTRICSNRNFPFQT